MADASGRDGRQTPARLAAALLLAVWPVAPSQAAEIPVYPGCDSPKPNPEGRTFYVDPVRGAAANDGSKARPWRRLSEALDPRAGLIATRKYVGGALTAVNPAGPVHPGDTLMLMSGDHGEIDLRNYVNDAFISVVAAPGQTPVASLLRVGASSHWLFRGLAFRGAKSAVKAREYEPLVGLGAVDGGVGPSDNIAFVGNSVATEEDSEGWSEADWIEKPHMSGLFSRAFCVSIVDNHFFNLRNAVTLSGPRTLAQGNLVERMGNDAFEITASDLTLRGNIVRDGRHQPSEQLHPDGVQGWTVNGETNRNVVIEGNRILNRSQTDDYQLQGISIYDGKWDGLTVANNLVITNIWNGIALYGVENARILNNTVLPTRPDEVLTWLTIHHAKDGRPSKNVIVRNNIAGNIILAGENVSFDHNLLLRRQKEGANGASAVFASASHNSVDPRLLEHFVGYDLAASQFDLRPGRASPAREGGAREDAPEVDIDGRPRVEPFDIGAFAR